MPARRTYTQAEVDQMMQQQRFEVVARFVDEHKGIHSRLNDQLTQLKESQDRTDAVLATVVVMPEAEDREALVEMVDDHRGGKRSASKRGALMSNGRTVLMTIISIATLIVLIFTTLRQGGQHP